MKILLAFAVLAWSVVLAGVLTGCVNARYARGIGLDSWDETVLVRGIPPVAQDSQFKCGYASMATVSIYYGSMIDALVEGPVPDAFAGQALTAGELVEMAEMLGLVCFAYQGDLEDLKTNLAKRRPVITLLDGPPRTEPYPSLGWFSETAHRIGEEPHWVVVIGLLPHGDIILHDPRKGQLTMSRASFLSEWEDQSRICVLVGIPPRADGSR